MHRGCRGRLNVASNSAGTPSSVENPLLVQTSTGGTDRLLSSRQQRSLNVTRTRLFSKRRREASWPALTRARPSSAMLAVIDLSGVKTCIKTSWSDSIKVTGSQVQACKRCRDQTICEVSPACHHLLTTCLLPCRGTRDPAPDVTITFRKQSGIRMCLERSCSSAAGDIRLARVQVLRTVRIAIAFLTSSTGSSAFPRSLLLYSELPAWTWHGARKRRWQGHACSLCTTRPRSRPSILRAACTLRLSASPTPMLPCI
jgi:hypothetical protein